MYGGGGGRDQKRSQQAFGKGSRVLRLGRGCSYRLSQANEASAGRRNAPQPRKRVKVRADKHTVSPESRD